MKPWKIEWSMYRDESAYPSFHEVDVEGPKGIVAKVFGRDREDVTARASCIAEVPEMVELLHKLVNRRSSYVVAEITANAARILERLSAR